MNRALIAPAETHAMAHPEDRTAVDADDVIARLKAFPNPHAIWAAFRAEIINEETALSLLPNTQREHSVDIARWTTNIFRKICGIFYH